MTLAVINLGLLALTVMIVGTSRGDRRLLALVPASAGGITTVQAGVNTTFPSPSGDNNTPEPTTLAILTTSILGFGLPPRPRSRRSA